MRKLAFLFSGLLITYSSSGQSQNHNHEKQIAVSFGKSKHGTGDIDGYQFSIGYSTKFSNNFSWHANLTSTLHDGNFPIQYTAPGTSNNIDGSYRYTTGGIQGSFLIGHDFLKPVKHRLDLRLGGIL